jgi:hypothetical protein
MQEQTVTTGTLSWHVRSRVSIKCSRLLPLQYNVLQEVDVHRAAGH